MRTLVSLFFTFSMIIYTALSITSEPSDSQHSTIIEKNHFYSNYQINTTYNIAKVNVDKPIILYLKKKDQNTVLSTNLTITLISGEKSSQCYFTSFDKMCFLDDLPSPTMKLKIKCDNLPCQASWTLLQPPVKKVQGQQSANDLFDISDSNRHMIAAVTCNNPQIKDFNSKVEAYSQSDYIRGHTNSIIYFLFHKQQKGHLYFKIQQSAKSCAQMIVYNVPHALKNDQSYKQFVTKTDKSVFTFENRPTNQFRIDASMHQLSKDPIASQLQIRIMGDKDGQTHKIYRSKVGPGFGTTVYDFSYVVPQISQEYTNLKIQFQSTDKILMLNFQLHENKAQVQVAEHSHFVMKTGQSLKYQLVGEQSANQGQKSKIILPNKNKVTIDKQQCPKRSGCDFTITAIQDVSSLLYIGVSENSKKDEIQVKQIQFIQFTDKITHKIRQDDIVYFKKAVTKNKVFQLLVNSPNVILYAASDKKCDIPSEDCYQKIGNIHVPFIYAPKIDSQLLIAAQGLDNCQFTITTLGEGEDAIQLKDNQPFAYLMDDSQSVLVFKFKNVDKQAVSFNLVAPIHQLILVVSQGKNDPDPDEDFSSLQGFASFEKTQIKDKQFRIMVKKAQNFKKEFIHFTLIATTSGANLRLDPGQPHYQTMQPKQSKDYVFQFDKNQDYLVNFYLHNIQKGQIKMPVMVSNQDKWTDKKVQHFEIQESSDILNLKQVSEKLCQQQGQVKCQIFIRLVNAMEVEVDVTLTLMVKDSVIQLKDGIWQSYAVNQIAKTSHFYFAPHSKNSISIVYRSNFVDLGIVYSIWKSDQKGLNPEQWPFPVYKQQKDNKLDQFKSLNHIVIDNQNLKECWPSCMILLSLYKKKSKINLLSNYGSFTIMASNQILQLPEKTKTDIYLKAGQTKYIMIDLKYALDKEQLTFFRNSILGYQVLYANVYSQKNQRCPQDYDGDFSFGEVQTIIRISSIKDRMSEEDMQDDQNIYLCITAKGIMESKFDLQYTSEEEEIKILKYDTFQNVQLTENTPKLMQMQAWQQYEIKVTRQKGYFYIKIAVCDGQKDGGFQECLTNFQDDDDKGKKIVSKVEEFSEKPCAKCIVYIRLQSQQPAELLIHIQSKYSTVQLKQKDTIADFTDQGQQNKYSITTIQTQQTIISVEVTEGEPVVTVTDYGQINITKQKNEKTNNIHIVIPPIQDKNKEKQNNNYGVRNYYGFSYSSTFRFLGVRVKSKNPKMPCAYTITYSSGERQTYLQDGLLTGYTLQPDVTSKFLYRNSNPDPLNAGYITISMNKSSTLYNLELKMFTFEDPQDEDTKQQVTPQKPPMRKKTPNPTMVFSLPSSKLVSIELKSKQEAKVRLMINNQQIIMLNYDSQFPFKVEKDQKINFLTDINNPGYLIVHLRKCDQSQPTFGYSYDYEQFQKSEFDYTTSLEDQPNFQFYIKASKIGTLYFQLNNNGSSAGIFSIKILYSEKKVTSQKIKSGNNGVIQYTLKDAKNAQIRFKGVICASGKCQNTPRYYWLAGTNLQDVYSQTVCPYSFFLIDNAVSVSPLKFNEIQAHGSDQISFEYPILDHISYISIRAIIGNEQVYYRPMQVITLWGQINKTGTLHKIGMCLGLSIMFCILLILYRRICKNRQNYDRLSEDPIDYD